MAKQFVVLITSLIVLIVFTGCKPEHVKQPAVQPKKPEILKPELPKIEPPRPEPNQVEPNEVEPAKIEPNEATAVKAEPNEVEPAKIEPNEATAVKAEPNEVEPAKIEPNEATAVKAEPNEVIPFKTEPNEIEPVETKTSGTEPNKVKPYIKVSFHDKCAGILNEFVNDKGLVNYNMLRRKRPELNKVLDEFAKLDPNEYRSWPKEDKIAFWLNAYNIKMLKVIVENYPIESSRMLRILWGPYSIRHIDRNIGGILRSKFIVMDEEFTLSEIDQRFFRKEFDEPRVFLAITHASVSSPPLLNEPYYGYKLNEQLDDQTKKFLSSPHAFKIDRESNIVYLSAILKPTWYGKYFPKQYGTDKKFKDQEPAVRAVLNFICSYMPEGNVTYLELKNYTVKYLNYDWTINDGS